MLKLPARLRQPPRPWPRPLPLPLPITGLTILALVLAPAISLWRLPRPQARGLERVLAVAALLQSFPADPGRPLPALWQQRLGPNLGARSWRQQRRIWWQFWGRHGDAGAYLALPANLLPQRPATAIEIDDLVVVAPDLLSKKLLEEQLRLQRRRPQGLEQRCLQRLEAPQGVFWTPVAVGAMAGPLAPLLQRYQQGCLSLDLQPAGLSWQGEASAVQGLVAPAPAASLSPVQTLPPLADGLLLAIQGGRLDLLLQGLTSRDFIREPMASRYGVPADQLAELGRSPFQLILRPQEQGAFKASLELLISVGEQRQRWAALLQPLRQALIAQGLQEGPAQLSGGGQGLLPNASWRRADGTVVGGWRWILADQQPAEPKLLFFLGPPPAADAKALLPMAPGSRALRVGMRPALLHQRGLLPPDLPAPVRSAQDLVLLLDGASSGSGSAEISWVTGDLRLAP
ncbi:MAG: hypothetical protein R6W06_09615 [Prochlorococcaceae cyanobacterium]